MHINHSLCQRHNVQPMDIKPSQISSQLFAEIISQAMAMKTARVYSLPRQTKVASPHFHSDARLPCVPDAAGFVVGPCQSRSSRRSCVVVCWFKTMIRLGNPNQSRVVSALLVETNEFVDGHVLLKQHLNL